MSLRREREIGKIYIPLGDKSHPYLEKAASYEAWIISRELHKRADSRGVSVECSHYVHGIYDWVICVKAPDIKEVKKYVESLNDLAKEGYVSDIQVLQSIFPIVKNGMANPKIYEFIEFF